MSDMNVIGSDTLADIESIGEALMSLSSGAAGISLRLLLRRLNTEIAALHDIAVRIEEQIVNRGER